MKKIAISQSNYIPWRGYFDLIAFVDEFVIFDEMQYTRRDWRNRNKIKTPNGPLWLTVPVDVKGKYLQTIRETKIHGNAWKENHWKTLKNNYGKTPFFCELEEDLKKIYLEEDFKYLSKLNRRLIDLICNYLEIKTIIRDSFEFNLSEGKTERLIGICEQVGAEEYVSGPSAKVYIDQKKFEDNKIKLSYIDYSGYQNYKQSGKGFEKNLSILDLIFNCGKCSYQFMKYLN